LQKSSHVKNPIWKYPGVTILTIKVFVNYNHCFVGSRRETHTVITYHMFLNRELHENNETFSVHTDPLYVCQREVTGLQIPAKVVFVMCYLVCRYILAVIELHYTGRAIVRHSILITTI
jgi:hypothetical protein